MTVLAFILAFAAGAIPTSYLWVRAKTGKDIRQMGSGNPGATNVFRCIGFKDGLAVLLLDAAKGAVPVFLLMRMPNSPAAGPEVFGFFLGLAAILGHVFTPFLGFRGGKGVATGAGVAVAIYPIHFAAAFGVWLAVLVVSRYMVLASLSGAYVFALLCVLTHRYPAVQIMALFAALFLTWTHRSNLRRIFRGEENRLIFNRKKI